MKPQLPDKLRQISWEDSCVAWFWYFTLYSFGGFLLEVVYARVTHSAKPDRKCFLLLPLCPVYGLGALAILWVARLLAGRPLLTALAGGIAATAVEYAVDWLYERLLGISFWDYSDLPFNLNGRVCLPFTLAWSLLAFGLIYALHPAVAGLVEHIPAWLALPMGILLVTDAVSSARLLRQSGTTDCLRWYARSGKTP